MDWFVARDACAVFRPITVARAANLAVFGQICFVPAIAVWFCMLVWVRADVGGGGTLCVGGGFSFRLVF